MNKIFKIILAFYILFAVIGACLLSLDFMRTKDIAFIDLLFNTTSAICVTGLSVSNLATDYTAYGQLVMLLLIQFGGLGFMMLAGVVLLIADKNIELSQKKAIKEQNYLPNFKEIISFTFRLFILVIFVETIGCLLLTSVFWQQMSLKEAIWAGAFHSISALNNAGFSTFENNLVQYRDNFIINFTITSLIIIGGLGFVVIDEFYKFYKKQRKRLSVHARIVLYSTIFLIIFGFLFFLFFEMDNQKTLGNLTSYEKVITSYFYSINLRTAGFNTIDISGLNDETLFLSSFLMIIGGGPGGTAGGIKTVTMVIILVYVYNILKNKDCIIFKRKISSQTIEKSIVIFVSAIFFMIISIIILSIKEDSTNTNFLKIMYEICSAFGTVGISVGNGGPLSLSANFSVFGKIYIMCLMLLGKVGVFAFSMALIGKTRKNRIQYLVEEVTL